MQYNVGYQISEGWVPYILEHSARIQEVYFAWGDLPNGRARMDHTVFGMRPWEIQERQLQDLKQIHQAGIGLDLLLNGTCYGAESQSRALFEKIGETVDFFSETLSLSCVTTASPLIAKFIKNNFPDIKVRASVNMEIGTVEGMEYVAPYFDCFYMKREYNRDLDRIRELRAWCDSHGKELGLLANSGCLNFCSAHQFHDNLVAHEAEIQKMDNAYAFEGICHAFLRDPAHLATYLRITNFIRPEDLSLYEPYFQTAKLATRINRTPIRVLRAYLEGRYVGSVMDLLEPNHAGVITPNYVENSLFPADFGKQTLHCDKNCEVCGYCERAMRAATVSLEDPFYLEESKPR